MLNNQSIEQKKNYKWLNFLKTLTHEEDEKVIGYIFASW